MTKGDIVYQAGLRTDFDANDKVVVWQGEVVGGGSQLVTVRFKHHRERFRLHHAERVLQPSRKLAVAALFRKVTADLELAKREVADAEKRLELVKKALAAEQKHA